ncbi:MAG: Fic family protein [Alphaproteobacteria bacterium]|nr:Fic family protein [Alphaproteobacteria bacterium]
MKDFAEYKKLGEPDKLAKSEIWQAAIGLQQVDGLTPSEYLIKTAKRNIEGELSFYQVKDSINSYYESIPESESCDRIEEADKVSARIAEILSEQTFTFSPAEYIAIHGRLFAGILDDKIAGKVRDYNIKKDEWVLNGDIVLYGSADTILPTMDYDFDREKAFKYKGLNQQEIVDNIIKFISSVWQIHPFAEGNTRVTAVFAIKYLRTLGFNVDNEQFAQHSLYFRNALVRANYNNVSIDVYATMEYIDKFFDNLLFGGKHILRNRDLQVGTKKAATTTPKKKTEKTRDRVLELIAKCPDISVAEMGKKMGLSAAGARWNIEQLKSEGVIRRVGARKLGRWEIIKK